MNNMARFSLHDRNTLKSLVNRYGIQAVVDVLTLILQEQIAGHVKLIVIKPIRED